MAPYLMTETNSRWEALMVYPEDLINSVLISDLGQVYGGQIYSYGHAAVYPPATAFYRFNHWTELGEALWRDSW